MKIIFICGSVEPGRDGVGDYTKLLAYKGLGEGHQVAVIALNDQYVDKDFKGYQEVGGKKIEVLRIAQNQSKPDQYKAALQFVQSYKPDWISLQFVPFAFDNRGFIFGFGKQVKKIAGSARLHVMVHELWVGMDIQSQPKIKIWGTAQKILIKSMFKALKPALVHTQSRLYQKQLQDMNIKAALLPLFSNIPFIGITNNSKYPSFSFALFGGIHYGANLNAFAKWLLKIQQEANKPVKVHFIGSNGGEVANWAQALKENNIEFAQHGLLKEREISEILLSCHVGITTTPQILTEKSGSVAAMHEHGLPVIAVSRDWVPNNKAVREISGLKNLQWHEHLALSEITGHNIIPYDGLEQVSSKFYKDLNI